MEKTDKKYLYAEKEEQTKRVNHFLTIGIWVYYSFILAIDWVSTLRGIRTVGFSGAVTVVIVSFASIESMLYRKNPYNKKLKYIASAGLFIVSALMAFGFNSYYVRFMAVTPFIGTTLYFDKKFSRDMGIVFCLLNIIANVVKICIWHTFTGEEVFEQLCATLAICVMFLIIYITSNIGWQFNYDTIHSLLAEQQLQQQMLDDVLQVANDVRVGTQKAMGIVNDLYSSTEVVNGAMSDISESTLSTAQNIQTQNQMTQNIQNSIGETLEHSETMVSTAKKSGELNAQSLDVMNHLKKQSEIISETNADVAASMHALQERMQAVRSIADTIFEISSQTNLLALNASIESARAGEAGRGFAVVADEIRQLAEKTREETEHIASILRELFDNTKHAADAVEKSVKASNEQDVMIEQASESFGSMNANVNSLIAEVRQIDEMLASLSDANNQIVENIMQLSAATEEVTASSSQAAELSTHNLDNAQNTKSLLNNVLSVSHQLDQYIVQNG